MAEIEIQLMGPLRVLVDGEEAPLPRSRKARALLAMLALEPGEHPRASLCAHLWPETADPRADLRWSLSKLRGVLGQDAIVAAAGSVRLNGERVVTDVARLEALLGQGPAQITGDAFPHHRLSSPPLSDLDSRISVEFELWLESQRHALRRLQQRLLAALMEAAEDPEQALDLARRRLALDPLNEPACVDLLRLTLEHTGRPQAQSMLEQGRARLREAGLSDGALLAAWRRLSSEGSPSAVQGPMVLQAEGIQTLPQKPSIAVLGFRQLDDGDRVLAEGLALELNSSLARLSGLFVIARASASRFSLATASTQEIGGKLGVRYLVHGSVRQASKRLRVTVELVECEGGEVIWSEHFERSLDDLFVVQDAIVDAIVSSLEPQIEQAERERARLLPTENLNAWECFHRAMWHTFRFTPADTEQARLLLARALQQDPGFARAHAGLSFSHFSRAFLHAAEDVEADVRRALDSARESVSLEPRDALGHWSLARALFLGRDHDQAVAAIDRALTLNHNYAQGHYARGFIGCHSGLADVVAVDLEMAQRLSPFDPLLFAMECCRAITLAVIGRPEEAADWAVKATQAPNAHFHIFAIAAACLELTGRHDEAARNVRAVEERFPRYTLRVFERSFPYKLETQGRVLSDALRAAGMKR